MEDRSDEVWRDQAFAVVGMADAVGVELGP
jgi:hypothetical protein